MNQSVPGPAQAQNDDRWRGAGDAEDTALLQPAVQLRETVTLQGWPGCRVGGHSVSVVSKATC